MELNQQVVTLEEDLKLLKGEIKAILKELRTALLSRDNPFATDSPPTFHPVGRTGAPGDESPGAAAVPEPQPPADTPAQPAPEPAAPTPIHAVAAQPEAIAHESEPEPAVPVPTIEPRWSLLTIASLAAWVEDSVATLGQRRFQLVLELAGLAGVVSDETQDVLSKLHELTPTREGNDDRQLHINECLVVIRQLEAILQGEKITKLPRKRGSRHTRVR